MRAVGALTVLTVHVAVQSEATGSSLGGRLLAHLNVGVTIFFLISGFLLYRPFIAHRTGGPAAPPTGQYAKRRVLRIYPAYWVAVTVMAVVPGVSAIVGGNWLPMYALIHTWPVGHHPTCSDELLTCGLAHTWSLVVELTFYLTLPLYAAVVGRLTRHLRPGAWMRAELILLGALSAASVALRFALPEPTPWWISATVLGYVLWFSLGMGMAVVSVRRGTNVRLRPGLGLALWLGALAAYGLACAVLPPTSFLFLRSDQLAEHLLFAAVAALLLLPAVFADHRSGLPARVLANPVVAWLGLVSYGVFLWHFAVTAELGAPGAGLSFFALLPATIAVTVPIAALSYYLVERPVLRLKYRRRDRDRALPAAPRRRPPSAG